ncbi:UNVERIFIED_CONTAM: hypothetical protein PYX00_007833 [Menopon gallinae]|uniref:Uncharacterized protein n=1 Tax=Menopon gallinae TaxID=328185 RepID=A0AAW2HLU9_9NEOP
MKPLLLVFLKFFSIFFDYVIDSFTYRNEKEGEIETDAECDAFRQRLAEETERAKELEIQLGELNSELVLSREKIKELEEQIQSQSVRCPLKDVSLQTDEDNSLSSAKRCSSFEKQIENFNLVNENINEGSSNGYVSENGDPENVAFEISKQSKSVVQVAVQTDRESHLDADDELGELRRSFEDGLNADSKVCAVAFNTLFDKYLALLDTYVTLHTEFEDYKLSEEKECYLLVNKSVRYLDELCSQLQNSGSGSSLPTPVGTPFRSGKKTDQSLSKLVRTPLKFLLDSPKQFRSPILFNSPGIRSSQSDSPLLQDVLSDREKELTNLKSIYTQKLNTSDQTIGDTLRSVCKLEERISKLESVFAAIQTERDELAKENVGLRENLLKNSSDISDIRNKLEVEIISLNPDLKGTLSDILIPNLLSIFIQTIMESCRKIQVTTLNERMHLTEKNKAYKAKITELNAEISRLSNALALLNEGKETYERQILESAKLEQDLLNQIKEMTMKIERYDEEVMELTRQKESLSLEVETLRDRKLEDTASENIESLLNEIKLLSDKIEMLETEIFESVKAKKDLINELNILVYRNETFHKETAELLTEIASKTGQFQEEIAELTQQKTKLSEEVEILREENEQYKVEMSMSALQIENFLDTIKVLTGRIEQYEAEILETTPQKERLLMEIKDLRDRIEQYEAEISESTKMKEQLLQELSLMNDQHEYCEKGMLESERLLASVKQLTVMNRQYEAEIAESTKVKAELLISINELRCTNEALVNEERDNEKLSTQIKELTEKNEEQKAELSVLSGQKDRLEVEVFFLKGKIDNYEMEILETLKANENLLQKMLIMEDKHDDYIRDSFEDVKLFTQVKELKEKYEQSQSSLLGLSSEKEKLFSEVNALRARIYQYDAEIFESSKANEALLEQIKHLKDQRENREKHGCQSSAESNVDLEERTMGVSSLLEWNEKLESDVSALKDKISQYEEDIIESEKEKEELQEQVRVLKNKHAEYEKGMYESKMRLSEIEELTKKNEEKGMEIAALMQDREDLELEICSLQVRIYQYEMEVLESLNTKDRLLQRMLVIGNQQGDHIKNTYEFDKVLAQLNEVRKKNKQYESEMSGLEAEKENLFAEVNDLRARIDQYDAEILETLKAKDALLEEIATLKNQLETCKKGMSESEKLIVNMNEITEKNERYKAEISELGVQKDKLELEISNLRQKIAQYETELLESFKHETGSAEGN